MYVIIAVNVKIFHIDRHPPTLLFIFDLVFDPKRIELLDRDYKIHIKLNQIR